MLRGEDRLIVALDVPTHDAALRLVDDLQNVSFFKVGLELFLAGNLIELLGRMQERRRETGGIFVDLKLSGDVGNTIASVIKQCSRLQIRFMTLAETVPFSATLSTLKAAMDARDESTLPQLLMVPFLSSLGVDDLPPEAGGNVEQYILGRSEVMLDAGCDGLIVSGDAIASCRQKFGDSIPLVSPGIRPSWSAAVGHKRFTTPADAIRLGADYLVVGQPIRNADNPRDAAQRVIDEIDETVAKGTHGTVRPSGLSARSVASSPMMAKPQ